MESVCICGRSFPQQSALNNHKRTCQSSKKRLSSALDKAKQLWKGPKRPRLQESAANATGNVVALPGLVPQQADPATRGVLIETVPALNDSIATNRDDDSHMTMMERRPWTKRTNRQLPLRFRDPLPQPPPPLPPPCLAHSIASTSIDSAQPTTNNIPAQASSSGSIRRTLKSSFRQVFITARNIFGLSRKYHAVNLPSHDPEEYNDLSDVPSVFPSPTRESFYPYPNYSSFCLGDWYWNGGVQKSQSSFKELLDIIGDPNFDPVAIRDTKWSGIDNLLAADDDEEWLDEDAGWKRTPVTISVPYQQRRGVPSDPGACPRSYIVDDFYHRSLVSVIREKLSNSMGHQHFHYEPYELNWQPDEVPHPVGVQGELYTSPAFIEAHREVQDSPAEPGCDLPRVVAALMFWSDATQLASFGDAKIWPLYMFFGNESKYNRCKPSCHLSHHVCYFQSLPGAFKDFAAKQTAGGKAPSNAFMTHCARELLHAQWLILLDDDFLEAWVHGIVITCGDGITRRVYPRIFTYSADYPEKILLASIRNMGHCPCPRCRIPLSAVHKLGMDTDMQHRVTLSRVDDHSRQSSVSAARKLIYAEHCQVNSRAVEYHLKETSLVPNINAFSHRLGPLGFDMFSMLVVDLMHEVELGGWKAIFIHLLRILESYGGENLVAELDRRYRQIAPFGKDSIRRFSANCSELKNMTTRHYENLLQCAMPVFDRLLPELYNRQIMDLLFILAHWHSLAKLRMHNDLTLNVMDTVTKSLGDKLREFNDSTCSAFVTRELKKEASARARRRAKNTANGSKSNINNLHRPVQNSLSQSIDTAASDQPGYRQSNTVVGSGDAMVNAQLHGQARELQVKSLNLNTYKLHALGDYTAAIRRYGTTDSYSTEVGELEHRSPKARYVRTSRKHFIRQMTRIERRQTRIRCIREQHKKVGKMVHEEVPSIPDVHHTIGKSQNCPENISLFLQKHAGDPAIKDFVPKLKDHLLPRVRALLSEELEVLPLAEPNKTGRAAHDSLLFKNDRIYRHQLIRVNYTTYDVRRTQDAINPDTFHRDIMLLANPDDHESNADHPFLYARVLGVFHANVVYTESGMLDYRPKKLEFLWVRWFRYHEGRSVAWNDRRLDCIRFPPTASGDAFGFVDPGDVLRGCHIIPRFAEGKVHSDGIGLSRCAADANDWRYYYVNRFVDRDMTMRYHWGLAVGHTYTHGQVASMVERHKKAKAPIPSSAEYDLDVGFVQNATPSVGIPMTETSEDNGSDVDQPELALRRHDDDGWEDSSEDDEGTFIDFSDDDMLVAMDDMYGI